jgi:hypothetical protein
MVPRQSLIGGMGRAAADLVMMVTFESGARERTAPEFAALLSRTGFRLVKTHALRAPYSILECAVDSADK